MNNLIISFNVVFPLFIGISLGYFLKRIKLFKSEDAFEYLNTLSFKVFLPLFLFNNIYSTDLSAAFNAKLIVFAAAAVTALFLLAMATVPLLQKENPKRGVVVQAIFRSNFALFGLPLALSLCGREKIGPTSILVGVIVPIYNILAVIGLEFFRGGKPDLKKILKGIITNPLIIASAIGAVFYAAKIKLPDTVADTLVDLGNVATPISLVALGGGFNFGSVKKHAKPLFISVAGKLIISPLLIVGAGILMGFRNETLVPLLVMSGAPAAVSSYPMAQQMGGDGELAGEAVVFTSALAVVTMFFWIFFLKQLGFI